ncbi:hypothetical protein HPP92_015037 [Vanilla planifolia]|uniref:Uncharacterized protein n=1 Tax=Vanilla planifolia TaxID=51239 RepID=A0A835QQP6_VANPL|nr:hypothetical protein HPP92_015037 [Vanilla planifolia]
MVVSPGLPRPRCSVSSFLALPRRHVSDARRLFCFSVFAIVVTNRSVGQAVGKGYMEYRTMTTQLVAKVGCRRRDMEQDQELHGGRRGLWWPSRALFIRGGMVAVSHLPPGYQRVNGSHWEMPEQRMASSRDCSVWSKRRRQTLLQLRQLQGGSFGEHTEGGKNLPSFNICLLVFQPRLFHFWLLRFRNSCDDN